MEDKRITQMEERRKVESFPGRGEQSVSYGSERLVYLPDPSVDEIDFGELLRKLFSEWKFFALILLIGLCLSIAASVYLTRSFMVEAIVRLPTVNELGGISDQNLLEVTPEHALGRFLDQLAAPDNQIQIFESSGLLADMTGGNFLTPTQLFTGVRKNLSIGRVTHDYYELEKKEKTPLKEIRVSLKSNKPELALEYISSLVFNTQKAAMAELSNDIATIKDQRIKSIKDQLQSLTIAADESRLAEIKRLEEKNQELINGLQLQIELKASKAGKDRRNQITQVKEALRIANNLNITDPVTWEDLRTTRNVSQITNEFGGADKSAPRYFQGSRILSAELNRLESREDDIPFISGITDLESQIETLENDPRIAALKSREDNTIYIEKFDDLQQQLSEVMQQPVAFENAQLAMISQDATISPQPTRNPLMVILVGIVLAGFVGLLFVLIKISLRKETPTANPTLAAS